MYIHTWHISVALKRMKKYDFCQEHLFYMEIVWVFFFFIFVFGFRTLSHLLQKSRVCKNPVKFISGLPGLFGFGNAKSSPSGGFRGWPRSVRSGKWPDTGIPVFRQVFRWQRKSQKNLFSKKNFWRFFFQFFFLLYNMSCNYSYENWMLLS